MTEATASEPLGPTSSATPRLSARDMVFVGVLVILALVNVAGHFLGPSAPTWIDPDWVQFWLKLIAAGALLYALLSLEDARFLPSLLLVAAAMLTLTGAGFLLAITDGGAPDRTVVWADVFVLSGYVLIALAVIWLPVSRSRFTSRALLATDVAISLGAVALIIWELYLWPARAASSNSLDLVFSALSLGYPTVMLAMLVALLVRGRVREDVGMRNAFRTLTLACFLFFLGDAASGAMFHASPGLALTALADLARGASSAAFCAAGLLYGRSVASPRDEEMESQLERSLSPASIGMMAIVLMILLFKAATGHQASALLSTGATVLMILVLGRQTVMNARNQRWLSDHHILLESKVAERTHELAVANAKLAELASKDGLTGLCNRRYFELSLADMWLHHQRSGSPLTIAILDVDFFKRYNDNYGHPAGDGCLQKLARVLESSIRRQTDLVARYGGEEFVVLMPHTTREAGIAILERARSNLEQLAIPHEYSDAAPYVSISIGVASTTDHDELEHAADLLKQADLGLYRAKEDGRNRIAFV